MKTFSRINAAALAAACIVGLASWHQIAFGQTNLANVPVAGTGAAAPKPNLMLLMDTSRSMAFTHMPDELEAQSLVMSIGYRSSQCNSLYYDPTRRYDRPVDASGNMLPIPPFTGARYNHYSTDFTTVNLSTEFRAYDRNTRQISQANTGEDAAQPAYYYQFVPTTGPARALDYRTAPCTDMESVRFPTADFTQAEVTAATTGGTWKRKRVSAVSGTGPAGIDERDNFAIWYTYYRTRMAMVKSSIGLAFSPVTEKFRVGLVSMNPLNNPTDADSGVASGKYLAISDFTPGHKTAWFTKLGQQVPDGSSPAREGLARVGRHFGGRTDGINKDMTPDPVTNSCQQNFTIMTTDGYWNTAQETRGPVMLDGTTKVGNQDGTLTPRNLLDQDNPALYSHRPIWDGTTAGRRTDTNQFEQSRYAECATGQFYKTTSVVRRATTQSVQRTQSLTVSTSQISQSTSQTSRSTTQATRTTSTSTRRTTQALASTQQTTLSTRQEERTRRWYTQGTSTILQRTRQILQDTRYTERTIVRRQSRTIERFETKTQISLSTSQLQRRTTQPIANTTQRLETKTQLFIRTSKPVQSTSQARASTRREFERTSQQFSYNGATEQSLPVASCTPGGNITCFTLVTGPTATASCTPQAPTSSNSFLARTCDAPALTGPTPVAACTPISASAGNGYTTTTCDVATTGPTGVASCTPASPSAANGYTTVTCPTPATTGPTLVATCNASGATSGNGYTITTCTPVVVGPTPVASCAASGANSGNNFTATTCPTPITSATPVAACTPASAGAGNNFTTTTCSAVTTGPTNVASCTPGTSGTFVTTTCATVTTGPTPTSSSCTTGTNGSGLTTTCTTATIQAETRVASCTQGTSAGPDFIRTTCRTATSGYSNNVACVNTPPSSSNNFTQTECRDTTPSGGAPTPVLPANCTPSSIPGTGRITTCVPREFLAVPTANCTPNTTGPSFVTCNEVLTGPTPVASCTPGGGSHTNFVITTCETVNTTPTNVPACVPQAPGPGNGNVGIVCGQYEETLGVPPGSCVAQAPLPSNNYVTIECPPPRITGPTPVPLNSCTNTPASSANNYIATTCATSGPTPPTPVATCTSGTAADFTVTTCTSNNTAAVAVVPGSCPANIAATADNQFTATICTNPTSTVGVTPGSCTPSAPGALTRITCGTTNTGPTFVAPGNCTPGTNANFLTTSCNTVTQGPTLVAACTPGTGANFLVTTCNTATTGPTALTPGSACTNAAPSADNNWTRTTCTGSDVSVGVAAGTCVPSAAGILPVVTCSQATTAPTPAASCTPGTDSNFMTTTCTPEVIGPERTASCGAVSPTAGNGFQTTTCTPVAGLKIQTNKQTIRTTYTVSGTAVIEGTGVAEPAEETGWQDAGQCFAEPLRPPAIDLRPGWLQSTTGMPTGCSGWPCPGTLDTSTAVLGSLNSLADVAQYYYVTDLRPTGVGLDAETVKNDVPRIGSGIEDDRAPWQHMTTFVVGLGVSGSLDYRPEYKTGAGDFGKIRDYDLKPALNWPLWPASDTMDALQYNDPRSIDDFWHTAANGRGKFFSARDPKSVVDGLKEALAGIEAQAGAGAGAATSSLTPVAGDNVAYTGSFTTSDWTGDLQAQEINTATGGLSSTINWSARGKLDLATQADCDNRNIYARNPLSGSLVEFTWNTKRCGGGTTTALPSSMQAIFSNAGPLAAADPNGLSQWPTMTDGSGTTVNQRTAVVGANLVNFIRGQRGKEGFVPNDIDKLYRTREHVLGDIVNSQPAYVKAPSYTYYDTGYAAFKTAHADRTPMVYVGANDGMLHAFYAPSKPTDPLIAKAGEEAWAFVPSAVMPELWKLADTSYSEKHIFTVDGAPTTGDVFDPTANAWKTILVGGLNKGGKAYYALDVTNPTAPKALWEFTETNLGLTFGRPVITKLKNGTWVVIVTSGYNNSDGKGYLYVLNAVTGAVISKIATGAGSTVSPSGLREINYFVANGAYDNTALRVYGGDLLGNIWRFDINDVIEPAGLEATLLGTAKDKNNKPQPITTRPELAEVSGSTMVFVGTGQLLSSDDLLDPSLQTVYGIKDGLGSTSPAYENLRTALKPLTLTQTGSGSSATRTIACTGAAATDCSSTNGWFIDLPDGGERVNVDMQSVLGTLVFATNVPSTTLCAAGGYSWLNYVNLVTGEAVASSPGGVVSVPFFENSVVVGLGLVGLPDGTLRALGRDATGATRALPVPVGTPPPLGKRITWREITQ